MTLKETHSLRIADLISAHHAGMLNLDEQAELDAAILADPMLKHAFEALSDTKQLHADLEVMNAFDPELTIGNFHAQVAKPSNFKLWRRITVAAAAVAAITLGVWFFYTGSPILNRNSDVAYKNDIAPGRNTATLTLANGKVISLDTNKTSVIVTDSVKTITMLTASTPRGGTYQVTLPDGTHVWLNADSKISFPSQFSGKQRKISLAGEAYFEVYKNKRMPFIVESNGQQVEVLGTHFNINAYKDEASTKTTLLEGSVRVVFGSPLASRSSPPQGEMALAREGNKINNNPLSPQRSSLPGRERNIVLKPNEQSTVSSDNQIKVTQVDANETIAWKEGLFRFENENIKSAMRKLERWYNVRVSYEKGVENSRIGGIISRYENVAEVLNMINATKTVTCKLEGREIIVMPYKN